MIVELFMAWTPSPGDLCITAIGLSGEQWTTLRTKTKKIKYIETFSWKEIIPSSKDTSNKKQYYLAIGGIKNIENL